MGRTRAKATSGFSYIKKRWFDKNPPDANGFYECWLCKQPVHKDKVSLDHVLPVETYPEYAKELSNLRPSHTFCNQERAHSTLQQYKRRGVIGFRRKGGSKHGRN